VSVCELKRDPDLYDHKLIRVQGTISHEFEDFTIRDAACPDFDNQTWLRYGGDASEDVTYCCPGSGTARKAAPLEVEGIEVALQRDEALERLRRLLNSYRIDRHARVIYVQTNPSYTVTSTLVGRFFAGTKRHPIFGPHRGFGHMGCCTLLAIQQVLSIDSVVSNIKPGESSCYNEGRLDRSDESAVAARNAEILASGERWRTKDERRIATEALDAYLKKPLPGLQFRGCHRTHLTYADKQDEQYHASCNWTAADSDSYTVELMKFHFLKNATNRWKDIAWLPYQITRYHCSDGSDLR
jgi:hypothetical protein